MMFKNPFSSLVTRTGAAIGHAGERVMTQAVGGLGGIRKRLQANADGSTTMLHTQNGLARFSGSKKACGISVGPQEYDQNGSRFLVTFTKATTFPKTLKVKFKDITAVGGIDYVPVPRDYIDNVPQDHVTFSGMNVTVNYSNGNGYGTFFIIVESLLPSEKTYKISVGCASAIGTTGQEVPQ